MRPLFSLTSLVFFLPLLPAQDSPGWHRFHSKTGGFTLSFPGGPPAEQKQIVRTPTGNLDVTSYVFESKQNPGRYLVSFSEYPEGAVATGTDEKRLDYARDGLVSRSKGKLVSESRIKVEGFPGRDLVIEMEPNNALRTRMFAVKNRLFQVMVLGPRKMVQAKTTEIFLESFQLAN